VLPFLDKKRMRPFLLYAPSGLVPDGIREALAEAGAEVLVAASLEDAVALLSSERPDVVLVLPPAGAADAVPILSRLENDPSPPPVFVLAGEDAHARSPALEVVPAAGWRRAAASLAAGAGDAASALLLTRAQLVSLLSQWEDLFARADDLTERALRMLAHSLDASRVSLFRWRPGDSSATVVGSSLGTAVLGRQVEIVRYPELRAAAARTGGVLVEEVERDPLMDDASRYLSGMPVRSLLCQRLPGEGSVLFLHAVRDTVPFGLSDVALAAAAARLLQAVRDARTTRGGERGERKRLRTVDLLFRGIPEPTALLSPAGEILLANPPFLALTGRLETELAGLKIRSLLRPPPPEDDFGPVSAPAGSEVKVERARLVTASGEAIPVEVLTLPASDETYGQSGWSALTIRDRRAERARRAREVVLEKDLAETARRLRELEETARRSDAQRARFWTAAAHELRTPLAIVQSHLEVVLTDLAAELPERPAGLLRNASESLHRLERLIADVLDAAAGGRPHSPLRISDVDLAEVLMALQPELGAQATRRGCALMIDFAGDLPRIRADRERLERLLFNLIEHAVRVSPKSEPYAKVIASVEDGRPVVRVLDWGPALSAERAARLFEDVGTSRGSAEFGLAVARRLAEGMGALLTAEAAPEGPNVKVLTWPPGAAG
jgi:signal transduction histidine kinase